MPSDFPIKDNQRNIPSQATSTTTTSTNSGHKKTAMSFPIAVKIGVGNTSIATPSNDKQYNLQKGLEHKKSMQPSMVKNHSPQ
jgi:hypothetical protein